MPIFAVRDGVLRPLLRPEDGTSDNRSTERTRVTTTENACAECGLDVKEFLDPLQTGRGVIQKPQASGKIDRSSRMPCQAQIELPFLPPKTLQTGMMK
jgi:hypothetical protein